MVKPTDKCPQCKREYGDEIARNINDAWQADKWFLAILVVGMVVAMGIMLAFLTFYKDNISLIIGLVIALGGTGLSYKIALVIHDAKHKALANEK